MAVISTTSLDELLKRLYAAWEIEQLVNVTYPCLGQCAAKGSASLGGSGFFFPVRVEAAEGHAYINETQALPPGGQSVVRQAQVSPTVHVGVVELSGLSMAVSSGDAMAFARSFDENVQQTIEAMTAYKEGAFFRDGTGLLTQINDTAPGGATTVTLDDVAFLREGMNVDIVDETATTRHDLDLNIDAVDWVNRTVTFASATDTAVADNDRIFLANSQADTGALDTDIEPLGLEAALLETGTYLNINRATYSNWKSNVQSESGFLDEEILLRARTRITQESGIPLSGIAKRFKAVVHPSQVDTLFKLAIPRIRYSGNDRFDLGNSDEVYFGNIPFVTSYLCPDTKAYVGDWMYSQSLYTPNGELHIDTEYNGSALKWRADRDQGIAFLKEYCQFVVKRPNAFVRITGLTAATR